MALLDGYILEISTQYLTSAVEHFGTTTLISTLSWHYPGYPSLAFRLPKYEFYVASVSRHTM